jgi:pimeloyl-ACP methyl ester carboxylesterase
MSGRRDGTFGALRCGTNGDGDKKMPMSTTEQHLVSLRLELPEAVSPGGRRGIVADERGRGDRRDVRGRGSMKWIPARSPLPRLDVAHVTLRGCEHDVPYLHRPGSGPTVLFVHGLGGAKENFYWATQSAALARCELLMFDQPGTGQARFSPEDGLDVSALAELAHAFAEQLIPRPYILAAASMGGVITLLQMRRHGTQRIRGYVNIEGNLLGEDCMFSRRAIPHSLEEFTERVFVEAMHDLRRSTRAGDQIIAHNMALNVDVRAYYTYSFETVKESDSGVLLEEFLGLRMPKLFLYGDANRHLSYLPRLRATDVRVVEVPDSGHFVFYDNPVAMYGAIGAFVDEVGE